jgi:hypothetical protein
MIELLAAVFVLAVGILSTFRVFVSSNRATTMSEAQQAEIHQAQREIERLQSLPYANLALTKEPPTSTDPHNPGYYVSSGSCPSPPPTYTWSQASGPKAAQLVIDGCRYEYELVEKVLSTSEPYVGGTVEPTRQWSAEPGQAGFSGTIYDYVTWEKDPYCGAGTGGCPSLNDYKRLTVAVTSTSTRLGSAPSTPVIISAIVADPKAVPLHGLPKSENPLENTEIKCTNSLGELVKCNYGLGGQTANTWYLTDSPAETGYQPPKEQLCMHYTEALVPTVCGGSGELAKCSLSNATYTSCPEPDLLRTTVPTSATEYDFSPNLSASTPGRVIMRDPKATAPTPCATATASQSASTGQLWASAPLEKPLKLSGNGGLTLYTRTLGGVMAKVTLCVGVYVENPVATATCSAVLGPNGKALLDPLNLLNSTCLSTKERLDSVPLGSAGLTAAAWPAEVTPLSLTFNYMSSATEVPAGSSIAVRLWPTAASEQDILVQYDAQAVPSTVQLNSE